MVQIAHYSVLVGGAHLDFAGGEHREGRLLGPDWQCATVQPPLHSGCSLERALNRPSHAPSSVRRMLSMLHGTRPATWQAGCAGSTSAGCGGRAAIHQHSGRLAGARHPIQVCSCHSIIYLCCCYCCAHLQFPSPGLCTCQEAGPQAVPCHASDLPFLPCPFPLTCSFDFYWRVCCPWATFCLPTITCSFDLLLENALGVPRPNRPSQQAAPEPRPACPPSRAALISFWKTCWT